MAADTARAVFRAVYGYWRSLPKERRPRLYLFGLSLGARNSDLSADFFDIIADPFQGALWAGPPWDSVTWRRVTENSRHWEPGLAAAVSRQVAVPLYHAAQRAQ